MVSTNDAKILPLPLAKTLPLHIKKEVKIMEKISPQQLRILRAMSVHPGLANPKVIAAVIQSSIDTCRVQLGRLRSYGFVEESEAGWQITTSGLLALVEQDKAAEEREPLIPETMSTLEIEVTKELMERIEKAAKESLHTPEQIVGCILANHFAPRKKAPWLSPMILEALRDGLAAALTVITKEDWQEVK